MWIVLLISDLVITALSFWLIFHHIKFEMEKKSESSYYSRSSDPIKPSEYYLFLFFIALMPVINLCYLIGYEINYIYKLIINKIDVYRKLIEKKSDTKLEEYKQLKKKLIYADVFKNEQMIKDFLDGVDVFEKLENSK